MYECCQDSGSCRWRARVLTMICMSVVRNRAPREALPDSWLMICISVVRNRTGLREAPESWILLYKCDQESGSPPWGARVLTTTLLMLGFERTAKNCLIPDHTYTYHCQDLGASRKPARFLITLLRILVRNQAVLHLCEHKIRNWYIVQEIYVVVSFIN